MSPLRNLFETTTLATRLQKKGKKDLNPLIIFVLYIGENFMQNTIRIIASKAKIIVGTLLLHSMIDLCRRQFEIEYG